MSKKYKLFTAETNTNTINQSGGNFPSVPMPTFPLINPISGQIQIANPVLPTINPTFNVYPRPLTLGPKINIFPQRKPVVLSPVMSDVNPCVPKPKCTSYIPVSTNCPKKKCDISLIDLLTNTKKTDTIMSPFSDGLPSLEFFK